MFNNAYWIAYIADDGELGAKPHSPRRRRRRSEYCLPARLPSTSFMHRESSQYALSAWDAYRAEQEALRAAILHPPDSPTSMNSKQSSQSSGRSSSKKQKSVPWKDPEPFEIYRAIERHDLTYLMEVRDRAFHLLLKRTQNTTPLLHAIRIGQSHRDVAIVLVGAFSRWINHLEDDDFKQPRTRDLLKALRANLKLAIDFGLQTSQSDLVASFMQALVMSEGEKWVHHQVGLLAIALRAGGASKPVQTASEAVRAFATKELGRAEAIAALEDYMSNATLDLVILGAWSLVREVVKEAEPIPAYYFARDDRVYKAFTERLQEHRDAVSRIRSRRLRSQLQILEETVEGRSTTLRSKVQALAAQLDDEHREV